MSTDLTNPGNTDAQENLTSATPETAGTDNTPNTTDEQPAQETAEATQAPEAPKAEEQNTQPAADEKPAEAPKADDKSEEEILDEVLAQSADTASEEQIDSNIDGLSKAELTEKLKALVAAHPVGALTGVVEKIRERYNTLDAEQTEKEKADFVAQGNPEEEFAPTPDPANAQFYAILGKYKNDLRQYKDQQEKDKEANLEKKTAIINAIEALINSDTPINKAFNELHDLQEQWRGIGLVPQGATKHLYDLYHHHVERFYDFMKINKELRELDFRKNMDQKLALCEKAEQLIVEADINKAFKALQDLHKQWSEIGPVAHDKKEELWARFKEATVKVNQRHHEHYAQLKEEQEKNLAAKRELCGKVAEINKQLPAKPAKWEEKSREIVELQKQWKAVGYTPRKDNNEIYDQFRAQCDIFFNAKRAFYDERRKAELNNLQLKTDLCVQAEAMKDSTEWKTTTDDFIQLQKAWKEIGPVPRRHAEPIWQRFRKACDTFFDAKSGHFGSINKEQDENLARKNALIERAKAFEPTGDQEADVRALSEMQTEWMSIGHVPFSKKERIQKAFLAAINGQYEKLGITPRPASDFAPRRGQGGGQHREQGPEGERNRLITKIRETENEISLYENNIGFFSKSANADKMIADIRKKIDRLRATIDEMKAKVVELDKNDEQA